MLDAQMAELCRQGIAVKALTAHESRKLRMELEEVANSPS